MSEEIIKKICICKTLDMNDQSKREFLDWWNSIPPEIKIKSKKYKKNNIDSVFSEINSILIHIKSINNQIYKPTIEELKYWIEKDQINRNKKYYKLK